MLLANESFANVEGLKYQLGYFLLMVDDGGDCNILHYGSNKCKRVVRSVMAAEVIALVLGFDYSYIVLNLVEEIMGRKVSLEAMIDSRTVFNIVANDAKT